MPFLLGNLTVIPKLDNSIFCPVNFINMYFDRFRLRHRNVHVNFHLYKNSWKVLSSKLSYSSAVKYARNFLASHNIDIHYTEKSCKTGAVTAALDKGLDIQDLMLHGRWRSLETPFHYRNTNTSHKTEIAKKLLS